MPDLEGPELDIPRRIQQDKHTPAEIAITAAMAAVEDAGCDVLLTEAVNLLAQAKDKVAHSGRITELRLKRNCEHECRLHNCISGTQSGIGDFTVITCLCGHLSTTSGKEEAAA